MPAGKYKTFLQIFNELKERLADGNLTFREINLNTEVPEDVLRILFEDEKGIISDISKLFEFAKIDLSSRHKVLHIYRAFDNGEQIKITRVLEPRASIYYDRNTQEFYQFQFKRKRFKESTDVSKELIINEMYLFLQDYLEKLQENE